MHFLQPIFCVIRVKNRSAGCPKKLKTLWCSSPKILTKIECSWPNFGSAKSCLGTCQGTKTDNFLEKFQQPLPPPPSHFRKLIFQIFFRKTPEKPYIVVQNLQTNFLNWKWPAFGPPFPNVVATKIIRFGTLNSPVVLKRSNANTIFLTQTPKSLFEIASSKVCRLVIEEEVNSRVAELGSLSSGAKRPMKVFVKRVFTIFASNATFLRVIANLQN